MASKRSSRHQLPKISRDEPSKFAITERSADFLVDVVTLCGVAASANQSIVAPRGFTAHRVRPNVISLQIADVTVIEELLAQRTLIFWYAIITNLGTSSKPDIFPLRRKVSGAGTACFA